MENILGSNVKQILVQCTYYNYKIFFSILLQAMAGANCKFIAIAVGGYGTQSDGGTFSSPQIYNFLKHNDNLC